MICTGSDGSGGMGAPGSAAVDALRLLITFIITQPSQNERLDEIGNTQVTDLSLRITHPL